MDALVQFLTALVVALAAMAFSHLGVAADTYERSGSERRVERTVKRSPIPQSLPTRSRIAF